MKVNEDRSPAERGAETSPHVSRTRLLTAGLIAAAAGVALFLVGYLPRRTRLQAAESAASRAASELPVVSVTRVKPAPEVSKLVLPGILTPLTEAYIYARATGYVRKRQVDIGDRVRAGQTLAEIEAPDLDEQVRQAQAALALSERSLTQAEQSLRQSEAQSELAKATWDRTRPLVAQGVLSAQAGDEAQAGYNAAAATARAMEASVAVARENIRVNRANLQRQTQLQSFERVQAPFTGIVTARNVDVGALISAAGSTAGNIGTSGAGAGEMYRMAQIDVLRVLVDVPEESAPFVRVGQAAALSLPAFPGRTFAGRVARTANALNSNTHTLLTEVDLRNPGELMPGMYAQVRLENRRKETPLLVPGSSIIVRAEGTQVAVLQDGENGAKRIHLQAVAIGRDYGVTTEITQGLRGGEYIVATPGDAVREGALVRMAEAPPAPAGGPKPAP
jgi:RND family efflux transporter MFP subunit